MAISLHPRALWLLLFCAVVGRVAEQNFGQVEELTVRNFATTVVQSSNLWFVKFYAPWCGHCKRLAPKWLELAERLDGRVRIGQIDATVAGHESLSEAWGIDAYPTLKLFSSGAVYDYEGDQSVDAMVAFALGGYNHTSLVVELTAANFDEAVRDTEIPVFIKFYAPWCGHCKKLTPTWDDLAIRLDGHAVIGKVDATQEEDITELWGVSGFPTLILVSRGRVFRFEGARDIDNLRNYVKGNAASGADGEPIPVAKPKFAEMLTVQDFFGKVAAAGDATWFINFFMPGCGACKALSPTWEQSAEMLQSEGIRVAKVDVVENRELAEALGVERFPTMKLIVGHHVYDYDGERSAQDIAEFARGGYKSAKLSRVLPDFEGQASSITAPFVLAFTLGGGLGALLVFGLPTFFRSPEKCASAATVETTHAGAPAGDEHETAGQKTTGAVDASLNNDKEQEAEVASDSGGSQKESDAEWVKLNEDAQR